MTAADEPYRAGRRSDAAHGVHRSDEGAGRIDDEARIDPALQPALVKLDRIAVGERLYGGDRTPVQNIGATGARIEQHGEHQARIVGLAVMIVKHSVEVLATEPRKLGDFLRLQASAWRQSIADRQKVVQGKTSMEQKGRTLLPAIDRQEEADRLDEMRRGLEQAGPFHQGFTHQRKLKLLEIAQTTMDQLGRGGRGGRGIVALLDQHHFQPTAGGITGDGGAMNTAANHENVNRLRGQISSLPRVKNYKKASKRGGSRRAEAAAL